MSEGSRRSRVTITLGRNGQVVNRAASDLDPGYELPRVGTKRYVKERLGNQVDSSFYGSEEVVSKRQRGGTSFSGNDLQISRLLQLSFTFTASRGATKQRRGFYQKKKKKETEERMNRERQRVEREKETYGVCFLSSARPTKTQTLGFSFL